MNRTGWILLFLLIAVCVAATLRSEHMTTASGYTLGASTNVGDTAYADLLKKETGQGTSYGPTPPPEPRRARMGGSAYEPPPPTPPGVTRGEYIPPPQPEMVSGRPAVCANGNFTPGRGCVAAGAAADVTAPGVRPICPNGGTYIPDPTMSTVGMCETRTKIPQPNQTDPFAKLLAPPWYTPKGTPAKVAPAALTGLQVGGPNDGGIGQSTGSGNASWGGSGVKYPNLLGPNNKDSNLPDNNMTAKLTLPTPCQVGADGNTLYSPGCRAPTDLGYFTLPKIPKTEGDPSPFSEDYTVFMK